MLKQNSTSNIKANETNPDASEELPNDGQATTKDQVEPAPVLDAQANSTNPFATIVTAGSSKDLKKKDGPSDTDNVSNDDNVVVDVNETEPADGTKKKKRKSKQLVKATKQPVKAKGTGGGRTKKPTGGPQKKTMIRKPKSVPASKTNHKPKNNASANNPDATDITNKATCATLDRTQVCLESKLMYSCLLR